MPLPPEPIVIPTSLTYRSALGRVLPLSNLELDGNMAYLEKLAEERLPISDFTGQNIIDLINQTDNSGVDAASLSSFRANIEPNINSIPVRDNNGIIFASGVKAQTFYGKAETAGDADTAKKLKTPVKINTVNFDGTADITIADSTKLPLAGGTLTGKVTLSPASALAAGIRITPGTAPDSPVNGDVWITNTGQFNQIAGMTQAVAYTDSNITGTAANVTGIVAISNGGTGATTAINARSNLGAAASGANSDITSLSGLTTALSVSQGGTGLKSPGLAGNILRSNGTTWESVTPSTNAATATALQTPRAINGVNFDGTADITIADSTKLPLAGGTLTGKVTLSPASALAAGIRITPGTAPDSPVNGDVWITNTGQFNQIAGMTQAVAYTDSNITGTAANVTGIVAISNGGTGATTAINARSNLGAAASGANSDITSLSGLTTALSVSQGGTGLKSPGLAGNILRSNGTTWESTPQFSTLPFIGVVAYFATTSIEPGWLPCDGAQYSRVEYKQLYDKIGITFGNGDGSGTTFNVPNLLNEFIRGVAPGRLIGSKQSDEIRSHAHPGLNSPSTKSHISLNRATGYDTRYATGDNTTEATGSFGGSETRPRNVALLPCIFSGVLNLPQIFYYPTEEPKTYDFDLVSGKVNIAEGETLYFVLQCEANKVVPITSAYWEINNTGNLNNTSFITMNDTFSVDTTSIHAGNLAAGKFAIQTISSGTSRPDGAFTVNVYTDSSKSIFLDSIRVTVAGITVSEPPAPAPAPAPVKTFSITSDSTNIGSGGTAFYNEGQTATIIVNTSNVPNKSTYKWSVTPVTAALTDLSPVSGTFTINNNVGSFTIGIGTDLIIENTEYFKVIIQDFVGNTLATSGDIGVINLPIPIPAPAPAPVEKVSNLIAIARPVGFQVSFSSTLIGQTLYITANRTSSKLTDNEYVASVIVPSNGTVTVGGAGSKFSAGQVVAVKTAGAPNHLWDGQWVASTTAIYKGTWE